MSTHTIIDNKIYDIKTEELDLSFRKLSDEDIDRLKRFKYIKKLDMSYCEIESLEFIKDMPYLYSITMCGKGFSEVDLSPIRECSSLKKISVCDMELKDLSLFSGLQNLKELDLSDTDIKNISDISSISNLETISLWGNNINDLSYLSSLHNLKDVTIISENVTDISPITSIEGIEYINIIRSISLTKLPDLSQCKHLKEIRLPDTCLNDSTILTAPALEKIVVYGTISDDLYNELQIRGISVE